MKSRSCRGNILSLTLALTLGVGLIILLFSLCYMRILGSYQLQTTAIEAASLAAAKDLGKIVIEDPYFGFISLSDYSPIGKNTTAGDNFFMPVTGINTLLATVRLDMIIADYMQDPVMQSCAASDYRNALLSKDRLLTALNSAAQPGGSGVDADGDKISPLADAVKAYQSNPTSMTGGQSVLVVNSMKLTLGCIPNLASNMPIPQPQSVASVSQSQQQNGFYVANIDIPYDNGHFVFADLASDTRLVDFTKFQTAPISLPYLIPGVVKCEADQLYQDHNSVEGSSAIRTVHAISAAELVNEFETIFFRI